MEFDYTLTTTKDFNTAVQDIETEIDKAGLRVLHIHNVQELLADKGFKIEPFKIIEFCGAKYAHAFLKVDIKIGLCMPCKINVYIKNGQVFLSGMRSIILSEFFPDAELSEKPKEVDQIIQNIINQAK